MAHTSTPAPLSTTLGVTAFAKAYSQVVPDSTGSKAVADVARLAGSTYLAAAEQASKLSYRGLAGLTGPMSATRVRLNA